MSDSDKEQSLDGDADAAGGVGTDPPPEQDAVDADAAAEQAAVDGDVDAPEPPARAANNGEMPALQDDHTAQEEADAARRRILTQFICNAGDANLASAAARVIVEGGGDDGSAAAPAAAVTVEEGSEKVAVVAERGDERGADREEARAAQPPQKAQRSAAAPSASQSQRSAAQQQQQKPRNNIPNNSSTQKQEQQQTAVPAALQQAQLRAKATSAAGIPPEDSAYFMHHYANMQRLQAAASGRGGGNASSSSAAVMAAAAARRRYDAALMNSMYGGAVGGVGMSGGGNNGAKGNGIVRASSGGLGGGGSSNVTMSTEEQKQRAMLERFVASGGVGYSEQERAMIESFCGAGSRKNNGANDKSNVPNNNAAIAAAGQKGIQSRGRGAEKSKQQPDLPPNHPAVPRARPPSPASVAAAFRKRGAIGSAAIVSMARDRVAANSANNGGGGADTNTFASAAKARYETLYDEELQRLIKERARLAGVSKSPSAEGAAAIDDQHRMRMQMIQMERGRLAGQSPSAESAAAMDDQHRMRMQMIQKERGRLAGQSPSVESAAAMDDQFRTRMQMIQKELARLGGQSPSAEGAAAMEDQLRMRMQMRHLNAVGSAAAQSEALRQYAGKDALMYERLMKAMQPKEGGGGGSGGKKKDNAEEDGGKSSKSAKSGFTPLSADGSKRRAEAGSTEDGSAKKAKFMTALPPGVTLLNERATSLGGEETTMSPMEELRTDPSFIDLIVSNSKQAVTGTIGGDSVSVREGAVKRKKQDALFGTFVRGLMNSECFLLIHLCGIVLVFHLKNRFLSDHYFASPLKSPRRRDEDSIR